MILDTLENADRYAALHPRFAAAFDFLRKIEREPLDPGRYPIDGEGLFAVVSKSIGRNREDARLESHRSYIDIQFIISGVDQIGWKPAARCLNPQAEYSAEKDIRFYEDAADAWVSTPAGAFCIFFPEDAHAPLVSDDSIHKVVVKVEAGNASAGARLPG